MCVFFFFNKIEIQAIFFIFNTNPRFPPFLLYVRCKSGVTFIRRNFRDVKQCIHRYIRVQWFVKFEIKDTSYKSVSRNLRQKRKYRRRDTLMTDAKTKTEKDPSLREKSITTRPRNPLYKFRLITTPKQRFRIMIIIKRKTKNKTKKTNKQKKT